MSKISKERRERMWDAVFAAAFAKLWTPKPAEEEAEPPIAGIAAHDLEINDADRPAAFAADDALERLDRVGEQGWGRAMGHRLSPTGVLARRTTLSQRLST